MPRGRALPGGSGVAQADVWGQPDRKQEVEKASISICGPSPKMVPRGRALPGGSGGVAQAKVWGQPDRKQEVD